VFVFEHYSRIASAIDLPLMIQDAEEDIFVPIELSFYPKIAKEFSHVFMVKVESLEPLKRIGEIQDLMGGRMHTYGAKSIIDELELGAYGHVPSSGLTDLFVKLFNDYQNGVKDIKRSDTYIKYRRYLAFRARYPLLSAGIEKEILRRRGVIDSTYVRGPSPKMSATASRELGKLLNQIGYSDG